MYEHNVALLTAVGSGVLMIAAIALAFLPKKITAKYPGGIPRNMQRLRSASPYLGFILWCAAMVILAVKFEMFYTLGFIVFAPELLGFIRVLVSDAKGG
jgi:hypothetical protein